MTRLGRSRTKIAATRLWTYVLGHPLATVFMVAFLARAVVAFGIYELKGGSLTPDDQTYNDLAATAASSHQPPGFSSATGWLRSETASYLVPLTELYRITGPHILVGQLYGALLGAAAASLTALLAARVLPRPWPLAAGLCVALFPSQVLWSSLTLKDATSWLLLAALATVAALAARVRSLPVLLGYAAAWSGLLFLLGHTRLQTAVVASVALPLAMLVGSRAWYVPRLLLALAAAILMPLAAGLGPAGAEFVMHHNNFAEQRQAGAQGARTAIVAPTPTPTPAPSTPPLSVHQPASSPSTDFGVAEDNTAGGNLSYFPHGFVAVVLKPFPWTGPGGIELDLARAEALLWYPLLALGLLGVVAARRRLRPLAFALLTAAGLVAGYSLAEGNVGTAYRHRAEILWAVAVFAAIGLRELMALARGRRMPVTSVTVEDHVATAPSPEVHQAGRRA